MQVAQYLNSTLNLFLLRNHSKIPHGIGIYSVFNLLRRLLAVTSFIEISKGFESAKSFQDTKVIRKTVQVTCCNHH